MSTPDQVLAAYKAQIESLIEFSHKSFSNIEKIVELNISTLKSSLEESSEKVKELLAVKDVQELVAFNSALAQPAAEKVVAYNKHLYELANSASTEISKLVESQIADGNKRLASLVDAASKNAPAGSESAVALVKSALSAASTAYDTVSKAAKQVADITEANVSAATNATLKAASTAAPARGKKAA
jgi:phasin family protein